MSHDIAPIPSVEKPEINVDLPDALTSLVKAASAHEAACNAFVLTKSHSDEHVRGHAAGKVYESGKAFRALIAELALLT